MKWLLDDSDRPTGDQPAFFLEGKDRFHSILVSSGVRYPAEPDAETVLTFFVIRRASGAFEMVNVMKTFRGEKCVTRSVQVKKGISPKAIKAEVDGVVGVFSRAIKESSGVQLEWHHLDLANVSSLEKQVCLVQEWGRVGVKTTK